MQKAARAFYIVGIVVTSIMIVVGLILTIVGGIGIADGAFNNNQGEVEKAASTMGTGIYYMVSSVVALIFTVVGYKAFNREDESLVCYILAIIGGVLLTGFSAVAGILSIVYIKAIKPKNNQVATESAVEAEEVEVVEENKDQQ